jgi:hypothetical protein
MKTPIYAGVNHLASELMNDMFYRQHYFGRIIHQLGFAQFGVVQSALMDKLHDNHNRPRLRR